MRNTQSAITHFKAVLAKLFLRIASERIHEAQATRANMIVAPCLRRNSIAEFITGMSQARCGRSEGLLEKDKWGLGGDLTVPFSKTIA